MKHWLMKRGGLRWLFRWLAIIWTIGIVYLFLAPQTDLPQPGIKSIDDWFHFWALLLLSFFWLGGYYRSGKWSLLLVWVLATSFGMAIEFFQLFFTESRGFQFKDVMFDTLGAAVGVSLFSPLYKLYKKRQKAV